MFLLSPVNYFQIDQWPLAPSHGDATSLFTASEVFFNESHRSSCGCITWWKLTHCLWAGSVSWCLTHCKRNGDNTVLWLGSWERLFLFFTCYTINVKDVADQQQHCCICTQNIWRERTQKYRYARTKYANAETHDSLQKKQNEMQVSNLSLIAFLIIK